MQNDGSFSGCFALQTLDRRSCATVHRTTATLLLLLLPAALRVRLCFCPTHKRVRAPHIHTRTHCYAQHTHTRRRRWSRTYAQSKSYVQQSVTFHFLLVAPWRRAASSVLCARCICECVCVCACMFVGSVYTNVVAVVVVLLLVFCACGHKTPNAQRRCWVAARERALGAGARRGSAS